MWTLVNIGVHILEGMFLLGMIGSALVIILSGVEDVETMFESNDEQSH